MDASRIKYELSTGRPDVRLRAPNPTDLSRLYELVRRNLPELQDWFGLGAEVSSLRGATRYIGRRRTNMLKGQSLSYFILWEGQVVGAVSISIDKANNSGVVMYWLDRDGRRRGIASCAVAAVIEHCQEIELHRLEINAAVVNAASNGLAAKLGFSLEALRVHLWKIGETYINVNTWRLIFPTPSLLSQ